MPENDNILLEMYENALEEFKQSGYHPHPANLLLMLLLTEKDKFEALRVSEGVFIRSTNLKSIERFLRLLMILKSANRKSKLL